VHPAKTHMYLSSKKGGAAPFAAMAHCRVASLPAQKSARLAGVRRTRSERQAHHNPFLSFVQQTMQWLCDFNLGASSPTFR
jgi:hypothetical protein